MHFLNELFPYATLLQKKGLDTGLIVETNFTNQFRLLIGFAPVTIRKNQLQLWNFAKIVLIFFCCTLYLTGEIHMPSHVSSQLRMYIIN